MSYRLLKTTTRSPNRGRRCDDMSERKSIQNRHEILFLYEARDCNPNGDPLDENRPRTDPETGVCTVTDVRIKRTVRDEILGWEPDEAQRLEQGTEILIRDTHTDAGHLSQGKERADHFLTPEVKKLKGPARAAAVQQRVLDACIDARLFGTTLPLDKGSLKVTGPVQFQAFNRSLHRVSTQLVQQTAAFASKAGVAQKSFAERQLLHYALIAAYGVANEVAARTSGASDEDLAKMLRALWRGTNNLATTSKMGHASMLLVVVTYRGGSGVGQLPDRLRLEAGVQDEAIRSARDYRLDVSGLTSELFHQKGDVLAVQVRQEGRLRTFAGEQEAPLAELLRAGGLEVREFEV